MDNIDIPPEWQYKAAVHWACSSCNPEITRIILSHGIDVNRLDQDGHMGPFYMLDIGNQENTIEVLELLLQAGLDINKKTPNSSSILSDYVSSITKPLKIIEWLLAHGANMNEKMNNGLTIYEFMCRSRDLKALADRYNAIEELQVDAKAVADNKEAIHEEPIFESL